MNLSSIRPSSVVRAIEDGFIDTGRAVAAIAKTTSTFIREKNQERRARAFERDAKAAGCNIGVLRVRRTSNGRFARTSA